MPVVIGGMAFVVWRDIFPLSAHPDLRFQLVGEIIEVTTILGIFALIFVRSKGRKTRAAGGEITQQEKVTAGIAYSVVLLILDWRDFFPADQFQFSAGVGSLVGVIFMGLLFTAFGFYSMPGKPSKEEEKSVA